MQGSFCLCACRIHQEKGSFLQHPQRQMMSIDPFSVAILNIGITRENPKFPGYNPS